MVNKMKSRVDQLETSTQLSVIESTPAHLSVQFDRGVMEQLVQTIASLGHVGSGKEASCADVSSASSSTVAVTHCSVSRCMPVEGCSLLQGASAVTVDREYNILIVGKTGSGKSTLGNALLGHQRFKVGSGMTSTTRDSQLGTAVTSGGISLKVVDTPDVENLNTLDEVKREITRWKELLRPDPDVILITIRCDVHLTSDVQVMFQQIKDAWGPASFCKRLVVAFTFGDLLGRPVEEELTKASSEERALLQEAGSRYIVFNNSSNNMRAERCRESLLQLLERMQ